MITEKELLDFGMTKTEDYVLFPYEKVLGENEEGNLALVVTIMRNDPELALIDPHRNITFLGGIETIDELKTFEKCITEWEEN